MDLNGHAVGHGVPTDEISDAIDVVQAVDDIPSSVIVVDDGPDSGGVLSPDEVELFAIGLEQAATAIAEGPGGVWIQVILDQRELRVEFVFSECDQGFGHGISFRVGDEEPFSEGGPRGRSCGKHRRTDCHEGGASVLLLFLVLSAATIAA